MAHSETVVSIHPYWTVPDGRDDEMGTLGDEFMARTATEPGCLYYGFTINDRQWFCREAYDDADAALAHVQNVGDLLERLLALVTLDRIEVHGSHEQLAKLREPFAQFNATFFEQITAHRR